MMWLSLFSNKWTLRAGALLVAITAFMMYRSSLIKDGEQKEAAKVAQIVAEQKAMADAQVKTWKEQANAVDAKNQELEDENKKLRDRNASGAVRLRSTAPSAIDMAGTSIEACRANATEAEHDLGECAVRYSALGDTASDAAAKAWELHEKWPAYQEFQDKLSTFQSILKGKQ